MKINIKNKFISVKAEGSVEECLSVMDKMIDMVSSNHNGDALEKLLMKSICKTAEDEEIAQEKKP